MKKLNFKFKNNKNAITLISLIITIIVLLILAGVSIKIFINNDGLFTKASEIKIETVIGTLKETLQLEKVENFINDRDLTMETLLADGKVQRTVQKGQDGNYYMYYAIKEGAYEGMQELGKGNLTTLRDVFLIDDNLNIKYISSSGKEYGDNINNKVLEDETKIRFTSKSFSEYVSKISGVTEDEIKFKWLKNQTSLTIDNSNITSLEDLVFFPNLTSLNLRHLTLENLQGIENCKDLKSLYIWYSKVANLEGIQYCNSLERYDTLDSTIYDYTLIEQCKNLKIFSSVNGNYDFEIVINLLKDKENLTTLIMTSSNINSIKSLENLKNKQNITYLNLKDNLIEKIEGLEGYKSLKQLYLDNNKITDITPLYINENIDILSLKGNKDINSNRNEYTDNELEKLNQLAKILDRGGKIYLDSDKLSLFTNYSSLDLSKENLENLKCLSGITNLKSLTLSGNKLTLTDVETQNILKNLTNLETIDLRNNSVQNISCLNNIPTLKQIYLLGNSATLDLKQIEDIISNVTLAVTTPTFQTITNCDTNKITKISCVTSYLTEIPNLSKFKNLTYLNLSDNLSINNLNNIENISSLEYLILSKCNLTGRLINFSNFTKLIELNLSDNYLTSDDLENLKSLKYNLNLTIDLRNNSIIDASALLELNPTTQIDLRGNINLSPTSKTLLTEYFGNNVIYDK